ncbi:ATP-dependent DNA helicase Q-like 5 [Hondaea fermentalgiana]|uniref:DNA 3'-5' helicase n=1 Tax=Hondaea fermentalgiana TaxID=2315210 RepID=A0A2R5GCC5_9STRA|nr:ATP-dependent DNA helicase Q-like 5 [Hondaea fermentalgiana]|eukprot:GBG27989.1 ATP-dependent DNA helicase Q-like 5 [Hondaea fermentalgiana]
MATQGRLAEVEARLGKIETRLRRWETQFEAQHGRPPTARDADTFVHIKTQYKRYGMLKKEAEGLRVREARNAPVQHKAAQSVLHESPQKRGRNEEAAFAVAASPELKRKRGDGHAARAIPGTPEQPLLLKRRRYAVAASPLVEERFRRGSTCSTPERAHSNEEDILAATPDKRQGAAADEIGASPITNSNGAALGLPPVAAGRHGGKGVSKVHNASALPYGSQSVLRRKPGQALRELGAKKVSRGSGVVAGAALAAARHKGLTRSSSTMSSRRAALLASPGVASPLKDSSNTHLGSPQAAHAASVASSPGSHYSSSGNSERATAVAASEAPPRKASSAVVKKCLFGSPQQASREDISEKLRALRPVPEKENDLYEEEDIAHNSRSGVIPASPEAPRKRQPRGDVSAPQPMSSDKAEATSSSGKTRKKPSAATAPNAVPARRELSQNFVKLDLRKNRWRDRKKGGSGRLKARKEMYESARGYAPSEGNDHDGASSGLVSQRKMVATQSDALEGIVDRLAAASSDSTVQVDAPKGSSKLLSRPSIDDAPLCPGHQLPAVLLTVKKAGKNRGKQFYACSVGRENNGPQAWRNRGGGGRGGCNFFMWADDQSDRVAEELLRPSSDVAFEEERLADARVAFSAMSVPQLKETLKRRGLSVNGKKADLVERNIEAAAGELERKDAHEHVFREMDADKGPSEEVLEGVLEDVFGFEKFRGDQLWAIKRIMQGKSSLLVQGTGSGKSLCYQLPALLLPGLTLVISPLVALMEDQLKSLPMAIPGAILSHQQSGREMARAIKMVQAGRIKVLFVSPERLFSSSFQRLVRTPGLLPEISLVCVDEAHCISSWSHNFRPAFLRLRELLARSGTGSSENDETRHDLACLRPRCVLGLTATATGKVVRDICGVLGVDAKSGLKAGSWLRENLHLEACIVPSDGEHRFKKLLTLLDGEGKPQKSAREESGARLAKPASVIVYVRTRNETELVAERLRSYGISARAYHGSMSGSDRSTVQTGFMKGSFRVVVATVAFGMGIDKANIRGVVHMGMPRSIEDYVQEVGRAGRDGREAVCVCMFDEADAMRLHSLAHAEGVDGRMPIRSLLRTLGERRSQRQIALRLDELALKLDMKEAVLETLIVHLSLPPLRLVQLLPSGYASCTISVLRSQDPASSNGVLKKALELADASGKCALAQVADVQGMSVSGVIRVLSELQTRRAISLTFSEPALYIRATDPADARWQGEAEKVVDELVRKAAELEQLQAQKIEQAFGVFSLLAEDRRDDVETRLHAYFAIDAKGKEELGAANPHATVADDSDDLCALAEIPFQTLTQGKTRTLVLSDLKGLMRDRALADGVLSGRVLARILHGISSPCYPYARWKTSAYWGKWRSHRFDELEALGDAALRELRIASAVRVREEIDA